MQPILIVGDRGSGKTRRCIELAHEHNAHIVCLNSIRAKYIVDKAILMNCKIPFPITYDAFIESQFRTHCNITGFIIDDIDDLVSYMARNVKIVAMSIYGAPPVHMHPAAWEPPETIPPVSNRLDTDEHDKGQNT